ncbi:uncharacterized protein LOC114029682, partial [Vombatus ursinus]|uniref:uncharacterized protein LOC114029682 n=1 Tax=Vombatus ursinus TaxID=29139 RepID=UPI000FFDAD62
LVATLRAAPARGTPAMESVVRPGLSLSTPGQAGPPASPLPIARAQSHPGAAAAAAPGLVPARDALAQRHPGEHQRGPLSGTPTKRCPLREKFPKLPPGRRANFPTKVTGIRVRPSPESPATLQLRSGASDDPELGGRAPRLPRVPEAQRPGTGLRSPPPPQGKGRGPGGGRRRRRPVTRSSAMAPAGPRPLPALPRHSLAAPLHVTKHPPPRSGPVRPGTFVSARPLVRSQRPPPSPPTLPRPAPPDPAPPSPPPRPRAHLRLRRPPRPRP